VSQYLVVNDMGDLVLSDLATITALADRDRFRLFGQVQRNGPVREETLVDELQVAENELAANLATLAAAGLVAQSPSGWTAPGRGLYVDAVPGAEQAVRRLYEVMISSTTDLPERWVRDEAPRLDDRWFAASGMLNARVKVTTIELDALQVELDALLSPYLSREEPPADVRDVRVLAYFMTEPD
jgi:hypothetical protein